MMKMKINGIVFSLFALMAIVGLAGCGADITTTDDVTTDIVDVDTTDVDVEDVTVELNDGFELYANADNAFSIQYPNTWEYQENTFGSHVMFFSPQSEGDEFRENVGIITEVLPSDMTVYAYYDAAKGHLAEFISDFDEVMNKNFKLGEFDAKKVQYLGSQGTYILKWQQVFFVKNQITYVITYTAMDETFEDNLDDVDAMVETMILD